MKNAAIGHHLSGEQLLNDTKGSLDKLDASTVDKVKICIAVKDLPPPPPTGRRELWDAAQRVTENEFCNLVPQNLAKFLKIAGVSNSALEKMQGCNVNGTMVWNANKEKLRSWLSPVDVARVRILKRLIQQRALNEPKIRYASVCVCVCVMFTLGICASYLEEIELSDVALGEGGCGVVSAVFNFLFLSLSLFLVNFFSSLRVGSCGHEK